MQIYLHIYGEAVRYREAQRGTANFRSLRHVRSVAKVNSASYRGRGGMGQQPGCQHSSRADRAGPVDSRHPSRGVTMWGQIEINNKNQTCNVTNAKAQRKTEAETNRERERERKRQVESESSNLNPFGVIRLK